MSHMPWLPPKPENLRAQLKALQDDTHPGQTIQSLAGHDLDSVALGMLSRKIEAIRSEGRSLSPLAGFRLGVLASATFDLIADILPAAAARHGVALEVSLAPYNQVIQQALDPSSAVYRSRPDAVLVAIDHRWLGLDRPRLEPGEADKAVTEAISRIRMVSGALRDNGTAPMISLIAQPPEMLFGHTDRRIRGTARAMIDAVNVGIVDLVGELGGYTLDVAALAETVGTQNWFSPSQWNLFKLPFAGEFGPIYADAVGRIAGAIRGKSRKCLVLDLDNTLWGGVVGDDGVENLKIGQGSPEGEAHLAVQQLALDLRGRGVILAVCSKNNEETARRPFRELPDMQVKESDIAVFQANWIDKASNLEAIAKALNIGIDALVLLDDNPAERAQARAALPMVAVPELPADPSLFAPYLAAAGLFEAVSFSAEDLTRAASYAAEARRAEVFASKRNLGDYLSDLGMVLTCTPFDAVGRQRIAQLINKSNQFNLTTRRYTESEVAAIEADPDTFTLQCRLRDKFGDFGMISVVICRTTTWRDRPAWDIDSWLMSCRVLGRKVEESVLSETVLAAKTAGIDMLIGKYVPTPKNGMVEEHYAKLGFTSAGKDEAGNAIWLLDLSGYALPELPMSFERPDVDANAGPGANTGEVLLLD